MLHGYLISIGISERVLRIDSHYILLIRTVYSTASSALQYSTGCIHLGLRALPLAGLAARAVISAAGYGWPAQPYAIAVGGLPRVAIVGESNQISDREAHERLLRRAGRLRAPSVDTRRRAPPESYRPRA